jgi:hypothetical protein
MNKRTKKIIAEIITPTKQIIEVRVNPNQPDFVFENQRYIIDKENILEKNRKFYLKYILGNPKSLNPTAKEFETKDITNEELNAISERAIYSPFLPKDVTKMIFMISIVLITVLFFASLYLLATQGNKITQIVETQKNLTIANERLGGWVYYQSVTPKPICSMLPCLPIFVNPITNQCQLSPFPTYQSQQPEEQKPETVEYAKLPEQK